MKLSVIIVSYNAKEWLEKCLRAAEKACSHAGFLSEIIVVDNHSADQTMSVLPEKFPAILFVNNHENRGFSKACNQGAVYAKGEFLLFLNPDTIVPENCFAELIGFAASRPDAGAIGVRMLDEKGRFLKESKRGFPAPLTSFYKLSGLTALFPRSKQIARYYLGHLDERQNQETDVVSGAFMLLRKTVFEEMKGFDERFFMYAEDIDLSYRLQQAGYVNYYYAGCIITHYKGKSTPKNLFYIKKFYGAMAQFTEKQYGSNRLKTFFLQSAIWVRASLSVAGLGLKKIFGK